MMSQEDAVVAQSTGAWSKFPPLNTHEAFSEEFKAENERSMAVRCAQASWSGLLAGVNNYNVTYSPVGTLT